MTKVVSGVRRRQRQMSDDWKEQKKRQYANSNPVRLNPVSFEMIEEKLKKIKPGRSAYNECFLKTDLY